MASKQTGRPSIFAPKDGVHRPIQILALTKVGLSLFERKRAELKKLAQWAGTVSNADVVEFMARGVEATKAYLAKRKG